MRYDHITMLPDLAFCPDATGRMTFEGGGGGGKGGGSPPPPPEPPKQVSKEPDANYYRAKNKSSMAGGMSAGPNTTMLTGPSGVDPQALSLGRSTLLGQ
jgi:hypothetical protein